MESKRRKVQKKKKSGGIDIKTILSILTFFCIAFTVYIGYRASICEYKLFPISLFALLAGLFYESYRLTKNWKTLLVKFSTTYLISLVAFVPGKHENNYSFEEHIMIWQYFFICVFTLITVISNKDKVTAKLTEGITLLLSISIIYWVVDYGFINIENMFMKTVLIAVLLFAAFSILNAFTYTKLSKNNRLLLSIWSTIVICVLAFDNIYKVFQNEDIESTNFLSQGLYIGLQYFLLGVSAIYIMQNFILLTSFFPGNNGFYKKDFQENVKDHIDRFSDKQVFIGDSLFCVLYALTIYGLNYNFNILPRNTIIWLVFVTFPLLLNGKEYIKQKNNIMAKDDLRLLLTIEDRVIAEDIQVILEKSEIYTLLASDNPAASIMTAYTGFNPTESVTILINALDYDRAIEILMDSPYKELLDIETKD